MRLLCAVSSGSILSQTSSTFSWLCWLWATQGFYTLVKGAPGGYHGLCGCCKLPPDVPDLQPSSLAIFADRSFLFLLPVSLELPGALVQTGSSLLWETCKGCHSSFLCKSSKKKRGIIRKAKTQPELKLTRELKDNRGLFKYISQKRKTKEIVPLLIDKTEDLITTDMGKAEVLNDFFASFFTGNCSSHISRVRESPKRKK